MKVEDIMDAVLSKLLHEDFRFLINESDLREIDLHETSKRTAFIEQTLVVQGTPFYLAQRFFI